MELVLPIVAAENVLLATPGDISGGWFSWLANSAPVCVVEEYDSVALSTGVDISVSSIVVASFSGEENAATLRLRKCSLPLLAKERGDAEWELLLAWLMVDPAEEEGMISIVNKRIDDAPL